MASSPESIESAPVGSWTVDKLKEFLRKHNLPVSGIKAVLVSRVRDCLDTAFFEAELNVQPFQQFNCEEVAVPSFESLPLGLWCKEKFSMISADAVKEYLQKKGGYTKNYRTGVRLCQCGHLYDLEMAKVILEHHESHCTFFFRTKCRPTMRKTPPFYPLFVVLDNQTFPVGGNCFCAAGASQSCVHIAALLFTLAEVTQTACTSIKCAWSRPATGSKATFSRELDFGVASQEGYFPYNGPKPPITTLLDSLSEAGCEPAIADFLDNEQQRESMSHAKADAHSHVMQDPIDKLAAISLSRDPTVDDLVDALKVNSEEAELIQLKTIGQRSNPLWMDARQWRVTSSNFGRVCNRNFRVLYPPSLTKIILGDYGQPSSPAIRWGCDHEESALQQYQTITEVEVDVCGLFLSSSLSYLGASPDGLMYVGLGKIAIVEVKCP